MYRACQNHMPRKKKKTLSDIFENSKHLTLVKYHHRCRLGTGYRCQFSNRHLLVGTNKNNRPLYQNRTGTYKFARAKKKKEPTRIEPELTIIVTTPSPNPHKSRITNHISQITDETYSEIKSSTNHKKI